MSENPTPRLGRAVRIFTPVVLCAVMAVPVLSPADNKGNNGQPNNAGQGGGAKGNTGQPNNGGQAAQGGNKGNGNGKGNGKG